MMRLPFLFIILCSITLLSCSEQNSVNNERVYEIRDIGELSTTEYTIGKIIKLNDEASEWYKYGDRKLLISCQAKVKAGIDLSKINEQDILIDGKSIEITLPLASITSFSMDPQSIRTEMESVNGFRDKFTQTEKNAFLKQGEATILKDLKNTGIIKDANNNAKAFVIDFYKNLGFEKVTVKSKQRNDEL